MSKFQSITERFSNKFKEMITRRQQDGHFHSSTKACYEKKEAKRQDEGMNAPIVTHLRSIIIIIRDNLK